MQFVYMSLKIFLFLYVMLSSYKVYVLSNVTLKFSTLRPIGIAIHNFLSQYLSFHLISGVQSGPHERRLINDLLENYQHLERPVFNETAALNLKFGLTLQQIIDVVSIVARNI